VTINPVTAAQTATAKGVGDKSTSEAAMGQDAFMRLLLTQLQNQDPTSPQADGEFLAQLAQFSSLEQLQAMNKKLDAIGRVFNLVDATTTTESSTTSDSTSRAMTAAIERSK
jgi:flagellar basal-body rod modification protein FlgD